MTYQEEKEYWRATLEQWDKEYYDNLSEWGKWTHDLKKVLVRMPQKQKSIMEWTGVIVFCYACWHFPLFGEMVRKISMSRYYE